MLLAGQRPSPSRALPASERNCSRGPLSVWRDPHRVSEAAGGVAEAAPPPPWPEGASGPGLCRRCESSSGASRKTHGLECRGSSGASRCPSRPGALQPTGSLGKRVSELQRGAGARRESKQGSPAGPGAPLPTAAPPPRPLRAQRRRPTGGLADPPAGNGAPGRSAHARQAGRRRRRQLVIVLLRGGEGAWGAAFPWLRGGTEGQPG